jgi:hypothetical protein
MVGSTLGVYSFGLIFVSARTNKRHHHHHEQTGKVVRRAGLAGAEWNEPVSVTALFMAAQKHFPGSVPSDTDDDDDTDYDAAYESDD